MNDTTAPRDMAKDTIAMTAATMGHDFLAAFLAELRSMPEHWGKLAEARQQQIIDRLKDKISTGIETAVKMLARGSYPAVPAVLDFVTNRKGITAGLTIAKDALCRHQLFDAQGSRVLVVIADGQRWTERMDEIKAKGDQLELFDPAANYDAAQDQPGYRRDQDPLLPGLSWADLKNNLKGGGTEPPEGGTNGPEGETKPPDGETGATSDLTADQERLVAQRILQEKLAALDILFSLGSVQSLNEDEFRQTEQWADEYAADPNACSIERPPWLPTPDKGTDL